MIGRICKVWTGPLAAALVGAAALTFEPLPVWGGPAMALDARANPDETAMIESSRAEAERQMGRRLLLKVSSLRYKNGWAFLYSGMINEKGDPLELTGTPLEKAAQEGMASRVFCALLKRQEDRWVVIASCLGATDVAWEGWDQKYHAPPEIFELQNVD